MVRLSSKSRWAFLKASSNSSHHTILSLDYFPAVAWSRGSSSFANRGSTRLRILQAPTNEQRPCTVEGGSTKDSAANVWGLACRVPSDQTQASTMAFLGQMIVLAADKGRLFFRSRARTLLQLSRTWGCFPQTIGRQRFWQHGPPG